MAAYEKVDAKRGISVKRGTPDVPDDGRFHVAVDGEIVFSTGVEAAALVEYEERRDERLAASRQLLRAETAARDARLFRNEVFADKASQNAKKGGKGRGGVGG